MKLTRKMGCRYALGLMFSLSLMAAALTWVRSTVLQVAVILLVIIARVLLARYKKNPSAEIVVQEAPLTAEVIVSPGKLFLGLGLRKSLPKDKGMLFVMPFTKHYTFCMRWMHFPIDILWINQNTILGIEKNVSHLDRKTYRSPQPVGLVLEVLAGFCEQHGINVGGEVKFYFN